MNRGLKISRILHAGYVFECEKTQIVFDPIFENPFSRNCYAFPNLKFDLEQIKKLNFAAVFISHYHDDHCSLDSLNLLDRKTPIYVYCLFEELFDLIRELGFVNVHSLKINEPVTVGPFKVTPRKALDSEVDSIFQINAAGLNILNVVDSWIDFETINEFAVDSPWDLVLWPFQTMREIEVLAPSRASGAPKELPPEWVEQLKILNPRYIVPSSCQFVQENWSWYNQALFPISYRQFQQEIEAALPNSQVIRLNPSVAVVLDKKSLLPSDSLVWVRPIGSQDVDYQFDENLKPPTTADISRHFEPLTNEQAATVYEYCRNGLLEKYKAMESLGDRYFEKPRLWRLSVYDHTGNAEDFYYSLEGRNIEIVSKKKAPLAWLTEVPLAKLYSALVEGESLTSMYMRVNGIVFEADIESDILNVEIVEDPLIRCLFNGAFGAYQLAQMKRLRDTSALTLER